MGGRDVRELSLFTGAGGGLLGSLILGWEPVQFVEHDAYCQRVLAARFPDVPCHSDVRDFHPVPGLCDIVTGGFPCTPHSQAGKRLGGLDDRDMWPDTIRVLRESGAPLGYFENVPGLLTSRDAHGRSMFGGILGDLSEAGFDAEWCVLGADDVGAPHRRKRLWILAYRSSGRGPADELRAGRDESRVCDTELADPASISEREPTNEADSVSVGRRAWPESGNGSSPWWGDPADVGHAAGVSGDDWGDDPESGGGPPLPESRNAGSSPDVGHAEKQRPQGERTRWQQEPQSHGGQGLSVCAGEDRDSWLAEPYVGRVAHGVASRVDRLRALGNGQVPQTMAAAFTFLAGGAGVEH